MDGYKLFVRSRDFYDAYYMRFNAELDIV